jgi:hypothetical protein
MISKKNDPNSLVLARLLKEASSTESASLMPMGTEDEKHVYLLYVKRAATTVEGKELQKLFDQAGINADAGKNQEADRYIFLLRFPAEKNALRDKNYCQGIIRRIKEVIFP